MALDPLTSMALVYSRADVPSDAVPTYSKTASVVSSTTPVTVKAAVTGKSIYVTQLVFANTATGEACTITVEDDTGTPVAVGSYPIPAAPGGLVVNLNPPVQIAAGKLLRAKSGGAVGDVDVSMNGYVGTPGA